MVTTNTREQLLHKTFPVFISKIDGEKGIVEAFVAVMGNIDFQDEIIHRGAFSKTLQDRGGKIRVLDNHNFWSTLSVVGKPLEIKEVGRTELPDAMLAEFPDVTGALFTRTQYLMNTPEGFGVFKRIQAAAITEYSIGFEIIRQDTSEVETDEGLMTINNIREIKLFEYSAVIFAANPATATVSAKSQDIEIKLETVADETYQKAIDLKTCENCIFFRAMINEHGYCKQHDQSAIKSMTCEQFKADEPQITLADNLNNKLASAIEISMSEWFNNGYINEDEIEHMQSIIPLMLEAISEMLPSEIRNIPLRNTEVLTTPKEEELDLDDTTTTPQADDTESSPAPSEEERLALIQELQKRNLEAQLKQ